MHIYSFGASSFDELALGASGKAFIPKPSRIALDKFLRTDQQYKVQQISGGRHHIAILVSIDQSKTCLLTCGSNEKQQLGRDGSWSKLEPIDIGAHFITQVAVGYFHNVLLTSAGQVFSFGCNTCGQLGLNSDAESSLKPSLIKALGNLHSNFAELRTDFLIFSP